MYRSPTSANTLRWHLKVLALLLAFFAIAPSAHASLVGTSNSRALTTGLVGWWTFDGKNMTSNVADSSGRGNHGLLQPTTATTSSLSIGKIGQALNVMMSGNYVKVTDTSSLNLSAGNFTISMWIYPRAGGSSTQGLIDFGYQCGSTGARELALNTNSGRSFNVRMSHDGTAVSVTTLDSAALTTFNQWTHVVLRSDAGNLFLYTNGILRQTQIKTAAALNNSATDIRIGQTNCGSSEQFNGLIDDVRVYNTTLATTSIVQLFSQNASKYSVTNSATSTPLTQGLVGWWTFDGKDTLSNVRDLSGQGNHLNFVNIGATSSAIASGKIGQAFKNGSASYALKDVSDFRTGDSTGAVSAWIKTDSTANFQTIFGSEDFATNQHMVWLRLSSASGFLTISTTEGGSATSYQNGTRSLNDGKWHHVVVISDGSSYRMYADAQLISGSANNTGTWFSSITARDNITIGAARFSSGTVLYHFPGLIDDVRVYDYAISTSTVVQLYNLGASKLGISAPSTSSNSLNQGLVGWWTFDGKNMLTNVADSSGSGNTGYLVNVAATSSNVTPGKVGQGFNFDGVNDYINCGSGSTLQNTFSFATWVKLSDTPSSLNLIGLGSNTFPFIQYVGSSKRILLQMAANDYRYWLVTSPVNVLDGKWHHLVVIATGNSSTDIDNSLMYLDGIPITQNATVNVDTPAAKSLCKIGTQHTVGTISPFRGALDDVRIYNRAISAAEVMQLYNMGR